MKTPVKELGDFLCENDYPINKILILKIKELLKKEKDLAKQMWDNIYNNDTLVCNDFETYWNNFINK